LKILQIWLKSGEIWQKSGEIWTFFSEIWIHFLMKNGDFSCFLSQKTRKIISFI